MPGPYTNIPCLATGKLSAALCRIRPNARMAEFCRPVAPYAEWPRDEAVVANAPTEAFVSPLDTRPYEACLGTPRAGR